MAHPAGWLLAGGAAAIVLCNVLPLPQETLACLRTRRTVAANP